MKRAKGTIRILYLVWICLAAVTPLSAETWKLMTGGDWGNANNWMNPAAVPNNGAAVVLPNGLTANAVIGIGHLYTINKIDITNDDATRAYTVQSSAQAGALKFINAAPKIEMGADNQAAHTISVPLQIDANVGLTFLNNSTAPLNVSSAISGNNVGSLVFTTGPVVLSGTSTYVGVNDICSAQVSITKNAALGDNNSPVDIGFGGVIRGIGANARLDVARTIKPATFGDAVDFIFAGDDVTPSNIFQVDSKFIKINNSAKPNLGILDGVRLTNAANDFVSRDYIVIGTSSIDGRLYLKNDVALGNAANKFNFVRGKIVGGGYVYIGPRDYAVERRGV